MGQLICLGLILRKDLLIKYIFFLIINFFLGEKSLKGKINQQEKKCVWEGVGGGGK